MLKFSDLYPVRFIILKILVFMLLAGTDAARCMFPHTLLQGPTSFAKPVLKVLKICVLGELLKITNTPWTTLKSQ